MTMSKPLIRIILSLIFNNLSDFHDYLKKNNHREIYTFYPGVGRQNDIIESFSNEYNYKINYQYDKYDMQCWPYFIGVFKFKKKIPFFLKKLFVINYITYQIFSFFSKAFDL